jgi:hypothetical protein
MNTAKMMKTANGLDKLFKVLRTLVVVAMIVLVVVLGMLSVVELVNPGAKIGENFGEISIGQIVFSLSEENVPNNRMVLGYTWLYAVVGLLGAAVIWYGLGVVRSLLAPMKQGQPFCESVCGDLKKLGIVSIAMGLVNNLGNWIEGFAMLKMFNLTQRELGGVIERVTINFQLDPGFVLVFFVIMLVRCIFQYGMQLQQLSDETL